MELNPRNYYYRAFGFTLGSNVELFYSHQVSKPVPDIFFTVSNYRPVDWSPSATTPYYNSQMKNSNGQSLYQLFRLPGWDLVHGKEIGDFYISSHDIIFHINDSIRWSGLHEMFLFSTVFPLWLEYNDLITLHASAVVIGDMAIAFLADKEIGKSTLAAAFLKRGFPLLTDDVLPVHLSAGKCEALPGYATMRLWPEEVEQFWGITGAFERVHPNGSKRRIPLIGNLSSLFYDRPTSLGCFYLLDRIPLQDLDYNVTIQSVPPQQSMINLIRFSYASFLTQAAGMAREKFNIVASLANLVPVCKLTYTSGYETISQVVDEIVVDINRRFLNYK